MYYVSWYEAVEFCDKLGRKEGKTYRLPTEAQWEYACRAGTQSRFSFGDSDSSLDEYAWYAGNCGGTTHPVGQKRPNAFGLYDMHGNVWEMCGDWSREYTSGLSIDPPGPSSGTFRIIRGGSWNSLPWFCRSANRLRLTTISGCNDLGFRVVLLAD